MYSLKIQHAVQFNTAKYTVLSTRQDKKTYTSMLTYMNIHKNVRGRRLQWDITCSFVLRPFFSSMHCQSDRWKPDLQEGKKSAHICYKRVDCSAWLLKHRWATVPKLRQAGSAVSVLLNL